MSAGMLAAVGLSLPVALVGVTRAEAQPRTSARSRALPQLTVRTMANAMAEMDPQAVKLSLDRYQVVQANELMEMPQLRRLVELVDDNSTARRNQNLMTAVLRQSQRLSTGQTVVGADLRRRQLFVADNRIISPTHGIR
jgi:hypothetical protein